VKVSAGGACSADGSASFNVTNGGSAMSGPVSWRVYVDGALVQSGSITLGAGETIVMTFGPYPGGTVRLEVDQRPGHPGSSNPRASVSCAGPTVTRPPYTATPAGTPEIWSTIMALPTSTPGGDELSGGIGSPCAWVTGSGGAAQLQCRDESGRVWILNVDIKVPCPINETLRQPYPRSLVNVSSYFALLPAEWSPGPGGLWSDPQTVYSLDGKIDAQGNPLEEGLVRNVEFGLRARRLPKDTNWLGMAVPDVNWQFTGNPSNGEPRVQEGITATYSYAAASYVGPNVNTGAVANKGRRFDLNAGQLTNEYTLPAYPVTITSFCGFSFAIKMEQSVKYWQQLSRCFDTYTDENGEPVIPAGFSGEGCAAGQIAFGEWRYRWDPVTLQNWTSVDMRQFGLNTTYASFNKATGGGIFKSVTYAEPLGGGIWVPVVEIQTIGSEQTGGDGFEIVP
jgi:hypothetical protein